MEGVRQAHINRDGVGAGAGAGGIDYFRQTDWLADIWREVWSAVVL